MTRNNFFDRLLRYLDHWLSQHNLAILIDIETGARNGVLMKKY